MARPRAFDSDAVLDAAQRVFHERGYEATSVQDLVEATGLSRSSLYGAWGDKHTLFLAVLDRYADAGRRQTAGLCESKSPVEAIRSILDAWSQAGDPRGGLLFTAAAESAGRDPETAERADRARKATRDRLASLVAQAQERGEVGRDRPASDVAGLLTGVLYGLRGLKASGASPEELGVVAESALAAVTAS